MLYKVSVAKTSNGFQFFRSSEVEYYGNQLWPENEIPDTCSWSSLCRLWQKETSKNNQKVQNNSPSEAAST